MTTTQQIIAKYPVLFHMAELNSWSNIQLYGLRSTSALLDLFDIAGTSRFPIESQWRPDSVRLTHPRYGTAVVRDQKPMPERRLRDCLLDMTTQQWYELINRKTFFWPSETPLGWMLNAPPYRTREHAVIIVPTQELLSHHAESVTLSEINSGSVNPSKATGKPRTRGQETFRSIQDFSGPWISELAVEYSVPNIAELASRVEARRGTHSIRVIWSRETDQ